MSKQTNQKRKIGIRVIKKLLSEAAIDPKSDTGTLGLVANYEGPDYMELRSAELIREARVFIINGEYEEYKKRILTVIGLLAVAAIQREPVNGTNEEAARIGSGNPGQHKKEINP